MYARAFLQGRNRDADVANRHIDKAGKVGQTGRLGLTYTHYHV